MFSHFFILVKLLLNEWSNIKNNTLHLMLYYRAFKFTEEFHRFSMFFFCLFQQPCELGVASIITTFIVP